MSSTSRATKKAMVRGRRPRGMLAIGVLVCLAVVMVLFSTWTRMVLAERQSLRSQQQRLQAEYLADAGLRRASAQLAENPRYTGETWRVDAQTLAMHGGATVLISVELPAEDTQARKITAIAEFPDQGTMRARRSQETTIYLSNAEKTP